MYVFAELMSRSHRMQKKSKHHFLRHHTTTIRCTQMLQRHLGTGCDQCNISTLTVACKCLQFVDTTIWWVPLLVSAN